MCSESAFVWVQCLERGEGALFVLFFKHEPASREEKNNDKDGWWDQGEGKQQERNLDWAHERNMNLHNCHCNSPARSAKKKKKSNEPGKTFCKEVINSNGWILTHPPR